MRLLILLVLLATAGRAETFPVIHHKRAWWDGAGRLTIDAGGVRWEAREKRKFDRVWKWTDIQHIDRLSETEIALLTYEDESRYLGRDRSYRFRLVDGKITGELMRRIAGWFGRPLTDRVVDGAPETGYTLPVKHLHSFGGCEGTLRFAEGSIGYVTPHAKDAREWRLDRDVDSAWSANPYHFELHVYDNNRREFTRTRVYRFDLKERLDPEIYDRLKQRLYRATGPRR